MIPFTIDNQQHRLTDTLNALLAATVGRPFDVAAAYFAIFGARKSVGMIFLIF